MDFLKKKVVRGKNRKEDVYFTRSTSKDQTFWNLKIGSEVGLDEESFMAYLKYYLDEWIKSQRLLALDKDDINRVNH